MFHARINGLPQQIYEGVFQLFHPVFGHTQTAQRSMGFMEGWRLEDIHHMAQFTQGGSTIAPNGKGTAIQRQHNKNTQVLFHVFSSFLRHESGGAEISSRKQ